ncbi:MAG TPA: GAF domain-containing protein [Anaerolineales bacterium]|nr:GAF domain-containing protein [Anaerolineales bacterium]
MKQFSEALMKRTGGWYIIIVIAIGQIIGLLGAIPGLVSLQLNVELSEDLVQLFSRLVPILVIASQFIQLGAGWSITSVARKRLDEWSKDALRPDAGRELTAWREMTNLTSRYGVIAFLVNFIIIVLPTFVIPLPHGDIISSVLQPTSITAPAPVYIMLGGLASILGAIVLTLLIIDRLTLPPRLILLPGNFETQLQGRAGALLGVKFQILILGLIIIGLTLIAPIGFQQTIRILYAEASPIQIFGDLQFQSILLTVLTLILGAGYSFVATRSISDPVKELIETFQKIEQGDLKQRVPVTATDELATVAVHFNRMVSRLDNLQSTLEKQVKERTKQIIATNEVGRVASSILDPDQLIGKVANLITEQFNYYYAAIYLLDPSEKWAELREATGQTGNVLKQNRYRLEIASRSMVATCIRERTPCIAQNAAEEKQRFENPLLPYTRSEIALPLIVGDRVLGALDVQSTKPADFGAEVIETMQNMAGQVAVALENARLFQEAQRSINELRSIQKQYLLEGWTSIKSYSENLEYGIGESSETASQVVESSINLRDQMLGHITLEGRDEWTPEQKSLVDAVTSQAAIALENARLVSESRLIAMRERTLTEINSKIWSSSASIDSILQTVVRELGRRLDVSNASIELNLDDEYDKS